MPSSDDWSVVIRLGQIASNPIAESLYQVSRVSVLVIQRHAHAETELSVVFEQRVAPSRSATFAIRCVWSCRQIAARDARTSRRVGDDGVIAEELRELLEPISCQTGKLMVQVTRLLYPTTTMSLCASVGRGWKHSLAAEILKRLLSVAVKSAYI